MWCFNEEGFEEFPATLVKPYTVKIGCKFLDKHGTDKAREVARKAMLYLRQADPAVHSFYSDKRTKGAVVDISVNKKLHSVASARGMNLSSLVRECLHDHLLNRVEPIKSEGKTISSAYLQSDYFSTLAAVLEPMEEQDLVNLGPWKEVPTYPVPVIREKFAHNVRVYGYEGGIFIRQILAFLDRPFNPKRVSDRYLNWLTNGYASTLHAS